MTDEFVQYIIKFLLGEENIHLFNQVSYGKSSSTAILIVPSSFFEENIYLTSKSLPKLPLDEIEGVPILFGEGKVVQNKEQIVVYGDLIASTFFLISRYEECLNHQDRDSYGRFIGKKSLPNRAGFLMRPIVDEYGKLLRSWFQKLGFSIVESPESFKHIYLTHDVDEIWQWNNLYRALRTTVKRTIKREKNIFESLKAWVNYQKYDRIYTFPWLTKVDRDLINHNGKSRCTSVYFVKGGGDPSIETCYIQKEKRIKKFLSYLKENDTEIGIHASMFAGKSPQKVLEEKRRLEKILGETIKWNRHHYLYSKEPQDMEALIHAGITDDFTMGYADIAGFRLGTCRSVRWINPLKKELTSLILHPLLVMDCTLDSELYMNLKEEEAFKIVCKLLDIVKKNAGEVVLLWHNTSVAISKESYQRRIYEKILNTLKENM